MKKSLIAAGIFALLASTGAKAADIVSYQAPEAAAAPAAPAQVNWNGFYIGGTIGGSWANGRNKVIDHYSEYDRSYDADGKEDWIYSAGYEKWLNKKLNPNSFIGGLYAGYNFQPGFLSQSALKDVVFGIETDFLFNSGGKSAKGVYNAVDHEDVDEEGLDPDRHWRNQYKTRIKQDWNGATRLRAGYALGSEGRFMPYIAGGVSYAKFKAKTSNYNLDWREDWEPGEEEGGDAGTVSKSKTLAGWNIGAGVDYVPPILGDHLVLRAEYRFTDFGTQNFKSRSTYVNTEGDADARGSNLVNQKVKFNQNDFRVGVAYKF